MADKLDFLQEAQAIAEGSSSTQPTNVIEGSANRLIDPDTVALAEPIAGFNRVRLPGIDALEVEHLTTDNKIVRGEFGGKQLQEDVLELVNKGGFNRVVVSDQVDSTDNRLIGDLQNEQGELLSTKLLYHNLVTPNEYSTTDQLNAYIIGNVQKKQRQKQGTMTEWDLASQRLLKNIEVSSPEVAPVAINEAEYASEPHLFSGVRLRSGDRTMMNKARSTFDTALELGKLGVVEGFYGSLEMFGDMINVDSLQKYGDVHQKTP